MKRMITIAAAGAFLLLAACGKKEGPGPKPAPEYDVYMAGYCLKWGSEKIACYWKNGERVELSDGTKNSECSSVTASGGSVYISGTYDLYTPCYWKDGQRFDLDDRNYSTRYITVDNGSVYVLNSGFYWKDNEIVDIDNYPDFSANAMVVSDGRVYAGGQNRGQNDYAACWSDGRLVLLSLPDGSIASNVTCATASGGSVYFGGYYMDEDGYERPCYWQDGVCTPLVLPQGVPFATVEAICVADGKVYAAGALAMGFEGGCYWVDGKPEGLEHPYEFHELYVTGIAVAGGKVYVSGANVPCDDDHKTHACYWVDGKRIDMPIEDDVAEMKSFGIALVEK